MPAVTAIDTTIFFDDGRNPEAGFGSGIVISPNYVLSAAHNFYPQDVKRNQDEIRVSNSRNQIRLNDREIGHPNDIGDSDATNSAHRLIYDAGSGDLFYDADGVGGTGQVQLAQLDAGLPLTHVEFLMV